MSQKKFEQALARYVASLQSPSDAARRTKSKRRPPTFKGVSVIITVPGCIIYAFDARLAAGRAKS